MYHLAYVTVVQDGQDMTVKHVRNTTEPFHTNYTHTHTHTHTKHTHTHAHTRTCAHTHTHTCMYMANHLCPYYNFYIIL